MAGRSSVIRVSVIGDTRGLSGPLRLATNQVSGLSRVSSRAGGILRGTLAAVGVGAVAAGIGIARFGMSAVKAGSDAQQSIGATESIFGKFSDTVIRTSNNAAKQFGLSANEYRENANLIGSLLKNQGVSMDELAGKTKNMVGIGSDLAATFGGTASDAVAALSSALKGEFDPLERYGISLKASVVTAAASALATKKYGTSLDNLSTKQQAALKQQATSAIIMKQSKDATGAFARESNTLAGQQQRLSAQFENVKAKIGTALLPVIQKLLGMISKDGMPLLERFATWFKAEGPGAIDKAVAKFKEFLPTIQKLGGFLKDNAGTILKLVAAFYAITTVLAILSPAIQLVIGIFKAYKAIAMAVQVVQLALNILWAANPIGLVVIAIAALVAIFIIAYKKSETFRDIIDKTWNAIKKATVTVWDFIKKHLKTIITAILVIITGPIGVLVLLIVKNWDKIKSATKTAWEAVKNAIKKVWDWIKSAASTVFNAIKSVITNVWNAIKSATTSVWNAVKNAVKDAWNTLKNQTSNAASNIKNLVTNAWNAVKDATSRIWNGIKTAVSNAVSALMTTIRGIKGKITGVFSGAASWLLSAGKNIIQGLLDGIGAMVGKVKDKLGEVTDLIPDWKGPASRDKRLLRPVGQMIMKGLIDGFDDAKDSVKDSLGKITELITERMDKFFKSEKAAAAATRETLAAIKKESAALLENAGAREKLSGAMDKAKAKLKELTQASREYAASIRDTITATGNLMSLQFTDSEGNATEATSASIIAQLQDRVRAAEEFSSVIQQLTALGLNEQSVNDILAAGVDAGLPIAQAVLQGGAAAITEINALTKQLALTGNELGNAMAVEYHAAGITAANALLKGLKSQAKRLRQEARQLAKEIAAELQAAFDEAAGAAAKGGGGKGSVKRPKIDPPKKGGGKNTYEINVKAPVGTSSADIGRELTKHLESYEKAGGRKKK